MADPEDGESRHDFLDNLRTFIIFLVVLYHSAGVYEATGFWASFWIVDDPATNDLAGLLALVVDIFVMPTLFFISGYLVPPSLSRRDGAAFLRGKARRLLLPWTIAVFTLLPLYKVIFLYSRGLPQQPWTTYLYFTSGFSQSWLWFLPLLFIFNVVYLVAFGRGQRIGGISLRTAAVGILVTGWVYMVAMDLLGYRGWTLTPVLDFQRERVLTYLLFFLFGALCFERRAFDGLPRASRLYHAVNATSCIPIMAYIFLLLLPILKPGSVVISDTADRAVLWLLFQISLFCLVYTMVETFRRYFDSAGGLRRELNRNSYSVYIVHVVVMGALAHGLLSAPLGSIAKFLALTIGTFAASNAIVSSARAVSSIAVPGSSR
jgi:fucose 4-O-acetylase-like acetyltransferase